MLILWLLPLISSKSLTTKIFFSSQNPWQEITRFGSALGTGNFSMQAHLLNPSNSKTTPKVSFVLYSALKWTDELLLLPCSDRLKLASSVYNMSIPTSGKWSKRTGGRLTQKQSPQVWYFVLADCANSLESEPIELFFSIVNPDGNHFSVEMMGTKAVYGLGLVLLLLAFGKNMFDFFQSWRRDEEITGPRIWMNLSMVFNTVGVALYYVHLSWYEVDGKGIKWMEFLAEGLMMVFQLSVAALLIVVANGWTILYMGFPMPKLLVPSIGFVVGCHLFLVGFSWFYELPKTSFSRYEEWSGVVILVFRTFMFLMFLHNLYKTGGQQKLSKNSFFYMFALASSIYFLTMPLLVYGSFMFPTYQREFIIETLNLFMHIVVFYIIYRMLTGKGDMYKINKVLSTLPGARSHVY